MLVSSQTAVKGGYGFQTGGTGARYKITSILFEVCIRDQACFRLCLYVFRCKYTKVREKCLDLAEELTLEKAVEIGPNHEKNLNSLKKISKGEPNSECHRKEETSKTNASTN